ncbi:MAG: hypothetical protein JWO15_2175 [Sphingomonadales bacterium]|nr:hypothetical protein [Sphingomonadales bacterium]
MYLAALESVFGCNAMHRKFGPGSVTASPSEQPDQSKLSETCENGRGDRIRTCDPLVPNQVRYQPAPLPDIFTGPICIGRLPLALWEHNASR